MIDEHSDYALALAVPSLNSDITSHFFSKATKLFLSLSDKLSLTTVRSSSVTLIKRYRKPRLNTSGPIRTHRK